MRILILFFSFIYLFAIDEIYITPYHAYTLNKNKKLFLFEFQKMNDTLDLFNLKEKELSTSFGNIGDMYGYKFHFIYGLRDNITLYAIFQKQNIQYGEGTVSYTHLTLPTIA
jgi:hypothetical protein